MVQELGKIAVATACYAAAPPFFCAGPVPYVNTCVHTKFEANPCTWAPSRTVDVSRFRVGRRAATRTAGGDRVAAVRAVAASGRRSPPAVVARGRGGDRLHEAATA